MINRIVMCVAVVAAGVVGGVAIRAQAPKSVTGGVFTADQAKRGQTLYMAECAKCHLDDLSGGKDSPPLVGDDFLSGWKGKTVGALFDEVRMTMPFDSPGKLTPEQYADVLAFMLNANNFPAGNTELAHETPALEQIQIEK
jgi:cytochrome c